MTPVDIVPERSWSPASFCRAVARVYTPQVRQVKRLLQVASVESFRRVTLVGCSGSRFSTSPRSRRAARPQRPFGTRETWPRQPSGSALPATGSRNITTCPASPAPPPRRHRARGRRHQTIRVGAGGIMLPNHAPLVVAEQFGTLESLFPGRIDLGLGRAPGTDPGNRPCAQAHAAIRSGCLSAGCRRVDGVSRADGRPDGSRGSGRGLAGPDLHPGIEPVWRARGRRTRPAICLRVTLRARGDDAGHRDLPLEFPAIHTLAQPYLMLGINVIAAATDDEARFLATSGREAFANLRRGMPTTLPPPNRDFEKDVVPFGRVPLEEVTSISMVGAPPTVHDGIRRFAEQTCGRRTDRRLAHLRLRRACAVVRDRVGVDRSVVT